MYIYAYIYVYMCVYICRGVCVFVCMCVDAFWGQIIQLFSQIFQGACDPEEQKNHCISITGGPAGSP